MKKILVSMLIAALLALSAPSLFAFQHAVGSGEKIADAVVYSKKCYITAVEVITDGSNDAVVVIYDSPTGANGSVIKEITVAGGDNYGGRNWVFPRKCDGIYVDVSGTGASYIIEYIKGGW